MLRRVAVFAAFFLLDDLTVEVGGVQIVDYVLFYLWGEATAQAIQEAKHGLLIL